MDNSPIAIPCSQANIIAEARRLNVFPEFKQPAQIHADKKVAIIGAGPAGLAAAAYLGSRGYPVTVFESSDAAGGSMKLIPSARLPRDVLNADIDFALSRGQVTLKTGTRIENPESLLPEFAAVLVAVGCHRPRTMGIENEEKMVSSHRFLTEQPAVGARVAVVGGGAVAIDCATTAKRLGAEEVTMFYRRAMAEMPLDEAEKAELFEHGIDVVGRTLPTGIVVDAEGQVTGLRTKRVRMGSRAAGTATADVPNSEYVWEGYSTVISAIGTSATKIAGSSDIRVVPCGDFVYGPAPVGAAGGHGTAAAAAVEALLMTGTPITAPHPVGRFGKVRSTLKIAGFVENPVSLETDFFGKKILNPFILSASPITDGYEQCAEAFRAGWAGCVLKTAFNGLPIHIPSEYMAHFDRETLANSDNVSGEPLAVVVRNIRRLVADFPDHLVIGSTGGPVTGDDANDRAGWQYNTQILEKSGCHGIEYSLSCPQGGDGTEGAIVSQSARQSAAVVEYVMSISNPEIPKLFKLTGAVTSVAVIVEAIKAVFDRYPNKKAGITLANSFPAAAFRPTLRDEHAYDDVMVVGMHGRGVLPISNLSLVSVSHLCTQAETDKEGRPTLPLIISGNGGVCDYRGAADFLALGTRTVQMCSAPEIYGFRMVKELASGLSYFMEARGFRSVAELIGATRGGKAVGGVDRPEVNPILEFMDIPARKRIPVTVRPDDCVSCGRCERCPYFAIAFDPATHRVTVDPARCVGCTLCVKTLCPANVLAMRDRTEEEWTVCPARGEAAEVLKLEDM
jgi:dihydropyrimidine dehydrogenase (NAD+) subunit PreA